MPRSKAIFFAMGDAKMRSPEGRSALVSVLGAGSDFGAADLDGSSAAGVSLGFSEEDVAFAAASEAPERSSPSSPMMAMGAPTRTPFVPSAA